MVIPLNSWSKNPCIDNAVDSLLIPVLCEKIGELIYWERKLESMEMRRKKTIKKQWLQSDPLAIKQEIQEIDRKYKDAVLAEDEAKWRLLLVGEKIEELDQQQSEVRQ